MSRILKNITELNSQSIFGNTLIQRTTCTQGFWRNTMNRLDPMTTVNRYRVSHHLQWLLLTLLLLTLYGCGNSVSNGENPNGNGFVVLGNVQNLPPDVDLFWRNLHAPILRVYCDTCHEPGGNGNGQFAHRTDIELAYTQAVPNVDRTNPANSRFVTKVLGGNGQQPHHCWVMVNDIPDCAASAQQMTDAIRNWISVPDPVAEQEANTTEEVLDPTSVLNDVVSLLQTPPDAAPAAEPIVLDTTDLADEGGYDTWVYGPIVSQYCQDCHSEDADQAQRQQPYFADTNLTSAFSALVETRKIDINTPSNSRLYKRLNEDSHNCWTDCATNAAAMLAAIEAWKNDITTGGSYVQPQIDGNDSNGIPVIPYSQGLELGQGQIISGGDRYRRNLVALWEFKEGSGADIADTSNVSPPLNLRLIGDEGESENDDYEWVGGYGIEFKGGYARATSTEASQKIYELIAPRNEYTLEAWVVPNNVAQEGPAVIASYSSGDNNRNFTMGQTLYSYEFLNRNTFSGLDATGTANGQPTLITDPDDEDLQATQQHVVMTYDPINGRRIYVNGQFTGDTDQILGGSLNDWNSDYLFVLGAESNGISNRWAGKIRLFAIYHQALSPAQVTQNFEAGVGQKFNLLFKVGHLTAEMPDESYIWFEAAEFDSNSYLFANPRFVVLGNTTGLPPISSTIRGMRIGVNGIEAPVGQVFLNMNKTINMTFDADDIPDDPPIPKYVDLINPVQTVVDGQLVMVPESANGTVIAQQNGPNATPPDQFYLLFKQVGDQSLPDDLPPTPGPLAYDYNPPVAGLADNTYISGVRMFEEINATMSVATGVPMDNNTVRNIYLEIQQALPSSPVAESFLASHQIAIAKLALGYCGELVDNTGLRNSFFPGFPFNEPVATAFDSAGERDIITDNLYNKIVIDNVASQPSRTETSNVLFEAGTGLLDQLVLGCSADPDCTPDANRTQTIVKSMCVTVLSSAAMTVQ